MTERLEDADLGTLHLDGTGGYAVESIDLGFPAIRAGAVERVNANGSHDTTTFYGARAVSLKVAVFGTPAVTRREALDRLRAYTSPRRRPVLYFDEGDGSDRRILLRGDQFGGTLEHPEVTLTQIEWVAPSGIIESGTEISAEASAAVAPEGGETYNRGYPTIYPAVSVFGATSMVNAGTEPAAPVLQLWGPCTDPQLENLTTGEAIVFAGLTLTAEQYVEVDVREATVRQQGLASQSVYHLLNLAATSLWWLDPGTNHVRYAPATFGPGARATVAYRSAWL
jgi:Phage tail protein